MTEFFFSGQGMVLLLVGLIAGSYVIQKFVLQFGQRFRAAEYIKPLGLLTLTPQCSVAVVRAGRETLVLGLTPHAVTLLTKTPDEGAVVHAEENQASEQPSGEQVDAVQRANDIGAAL